MTEHNRQFDDLQGRVSERFRQDLRTLWEPAGPVPVQVEQAILDQARHRLGRSRPLIIRLGWVAGAVAAAAVIVIGVLLFQVAQHPNPQSAIMSSRTTIRDRNIVTPDSDPGPPSVAFYATERAVSTKLSPDLAEGRADIDNDGRVDILDAFRLARHIESRGPAEMKWDLNGDGQVDRADVDAAAFAAVRLDKGV